MITNWKTGIFCTFVHEAIKDERMIRSRYLY